MVLFRPAIAGVLVVLALSVAPVASVPSYSVEHLLVEYQADADDVEAFVMPATLYGVECPGEWVLTQAISESVPFPLAYDEIRYFFNVDDSLLRWTYLQGPAQHRLEVRWVCPDAAPALYVPPGMWHDRETGAGLCDEPLDSIAGDAPHEHAATVTVSVPPGTVVCMDVGAAARVAEPPALPFSGQVTAVLADASGDTLQALASCGFVAGICWMQAPPVPTAYTVPDCGEASCDLTLTCDADALTGGHGAAGSWRCGLGTM